MSTVAYRAALVREIEQAMKGIQDLPVGQNLYARSRNEGRAEAYAHILLLLKDEDL